MPFDFEQALFSRGPILAGMAQAETLEPATP